MASVNEGHREGKRDIGDGNFSDVWRALTKTAADTQEEAYDRTESEFESLEIGVSENVAEYFARVRVVLKLTNHQVATPVHKIKPRVLSGLTPRFPDEVHPQ